MPNDTCILCGKDSPYEMDVNIDYRNGYIEGAGQLCENCWDAGTKRESMLIPIQTIKDTPNDAELGKKVRLLYWKLND
jgi:hypothetical protein